MRRRLDRKLILTLEVAALLALPFLWTLERAEVPAVDTPTYAPAPTPPPSAPAHSPAEPVAEPHPLDGLVLLATTVADAAPDRSRATLLDTRQGGRFVVRVGERLANRGEVEVRRIEDGRAVLAAGDRERVLHLDPEVALADAVKLPGLDEFIQETSGGKDPERLVAGLEKMVRKKLGARDPKSLQQQARLAPYPDSRHPETMTGVLVTAVIPGSFFDQLGLQPDDVLLEVNGSRMGEPESAERALQGLSDGQSIRIVLQGQDERPTLLTTTTVRTQ